MNNLCLAINEEQRDHLLKKIGKSIPSSDEYLIFLNEHSYIVKEEFLPIVLVLIND